MISVLLKKNNRTFSPRNLSTLGLWLDATDSSTVTLNGSNVSQWSDKSKNKYIYSQGSALSQPNFELNGISGKPCLSFNGLLHQLSLSSPDGLINNKSQVSYYTVIQTSIMNGVGRPFFVSTNVNAGSGRAILNLASGNFQFSGRRLDGDTIATVSTPNGSKVASTNYIISCLLDYSNANARIKINGQELTNLSFQSSGSTSATNPIISTIGASNGTNYFTGKLGEIIFDYSLDNINKIEKYLTRKWM